MSPLMPLSTVGSSTDHVPTYAHSSSVFSFLACETLHLLSQSSVNCSKNGALSVVGYSTSAQELRDCSDASHTVNVGLEMADDVNEDVTDSTTDPAEADASSIASSRPGMPSALSSAASATYAPATSRLRTRISKVLYHTLRCSEVKQRDGKEVKRAQWMTRLSLAFAARSSIALAARELMTAFTSGGSP